MNGGEGQIQQVVTMEPASLDGRRKLKECEIALRKLRFEEAITTPLSPLASSGRV